MTVKYFLQTWYIIYKGLTCHFIHSFDYWKIPFTYFIKPRYIHSSSLCLSLTLIVSRFMWTRRRNVRSVSAYSWMTLQPGYFPANTLFTRGVNNKCRTSMITDGSEDIYFKRCTVCREEYDHFAVQIPIPAADTTEADSSTDSLDAEFALLAAADRSAIPVTSTYVHPTMYDIPLNGEFNFNAPGWETPPLGQRAIASPISPASPLPPLPAHLVPLIRD